MTGRELKRIRKALGLSLTTMGRALGYSGSDNTVNVQMRRYERSREIPASVVERLAALKHRPT